MSVCMPVSTLGPKTDINNQSQPSPPAFCCHFRILLNTGRHSIGIQGDTSINHPALKASLLESSLIEAGLDHSPGRQGKNRNSRSP